LTDKKVFVVGIGDDGTRSLSVGVLEKIQRSSILYGGERQLAFFPEFKGEKRIIRSPLREKMEEIRMDSETNLITVLASGDPLFFGIGSSIIHYLGSDHVEILPNVSSIQLAFARACESWSDARIISLHGRPIQGLAQKLHGIRTAALFTDEMNTPANIARYLLRFQMTEYDAFVAEHLGSQEERIGWYTLEQLIDAEFDLLNVMILKRREDAEVPIFNLGMEDSVFSQRRPDRGLITKREVRVLSLSELALRPGGVLWDIGACTGSVSIESILSVPDLRVFAVEKNEGDLINLRENQVKFRTDFVALHAKAPEGLDTFPDPDAVFIGGSGGELEELLRICAARLSKNGRIVVNAATIENLYQAYQTLGELEFTVSVTLVQTARSKPILNLTRFEGMNPVYLVTGWMDRPEEESFNGS
jgi:precorrin-6Y C5,15-methyltransferase (decarboxylating)